MPGPGWLAGGLGLIPEQQHAMNMVWHDHGRIEFYVGKVKRNLLPKASNRLAGGVEQHRSIQDLAEKAGVAARADSHEVGAGLSIIVVAKSQAAPARLFRSGVCGRTLQQSWWVPSAGGFSHAFPGFAPKAGLSGPGVPGPYRGCALRIILDVGGAYGPLLTRTVGAGHARPAPLRSWNRTSERVAPAYHPRQCTLKFETRMDLATPLTYVKGIGPARAALLEGKGLSTVEDLLGYVPFRYEDRSNMKTIAQLAPGEMATVVASVSSAKLSGFRRRSICKT